MGRCDLCKCKCGLIMFTCPCCQMQYCASHRLPECHNCINYEMVKNKGKDDLPKVEPSKRKLVKF